MLAAFLTEPYEWGWLNSGPTAAAQRTSHMLAMKNGIRRVGVLVAISALLLGGCSTEPDQPETVATTPDPSASKKKGLCQPFPDRLIDHFIAA